jgi:hypothetical protein
MFFATFTNIRGSNEIQRNVRGCRHDRAYNVVPRSCFSQVKKKADMCDMPMERLKEHGG